MLRTLILVSLLCIGFGAYLLWSGLRDAFWRVVARFLARPRVTAWLIRRYATADRAFHIEGPDGSLYMERFLIFNRGGGSEGTVNAGPVQYPWLPFSVRLHHIVRPDGDRVPHDHPSPFRTFCLRGFYEHEVHAVGDIEVNAGDTYVMARGMFHRIFSVPKDGVWTLVIFGKRSVAWGFLVDGHKVDYRDYLGMRPKPLTAADWAYVNEPDTERRA